MAKQYTQKISPFDAEMAEAAMLYLCQMVNPEDTFDRRQGDLACVPRGRTSEMLGRLSVVTTNIPLETKVISGAAQELNVIVSPCLKDMVATNGAVGSIPVFATMRATNEYTPFPTGATDARQGIYAPDEYFAIGQGAVNPQSTIPVLLNSDVGFSIPFSRKTVSGVAGYFNRVNTTGVQVAAVVGTLAFQHFWNNAACEFRMYGGSGVDPTFTAADPLLATATSTAGGLGQSSFSIPALTWNSLNWLYFSFVKPTNPGNYAYLKHFSVDFSAIEQPLTDNGRILQRFDATHLAQIAETGTQYRVVSQSALLQFTATSTSKGGILAASRCQPWLRAKSPDEAAFTYAELSSFPKNYTGPVSKGAYVWWTPGTEDEANEFIPMDGVRSNQGTVMAFAAQPQLGLDGHNPTFNLRVVTVIFVPTTLQHLAPTMYYTPSFAADALELISRDMPWATCNPMHVKLLDQLKTYAQRGVRWVRDNPHVWMPLIAKGIGAAAAVL